MRAYQNVMLDGRDIGERPSRRYSQFCNEGKWRNFIAPLLPDDCTDCTFVEIGCNAGLFLRLAKERGFRHVVGVESDENAYRVALAYRAAGGLSYEVRHALIGDGFDYDSLPAADVVLLANFHYHLPISDFLHLLDALQHKASTCLVVSAGTHPRHHWQPEPNVEKVRYYFREWREIGMVGPLSTVGDPHPRDMYSILFASEIKRRPLTEIKLLHERNTRNRQRAVDFVRQALHCEDLDITRTDYYQTQARERQSDKRPNPWTADMVHEYMVGKFHLIRDVQAHGLRSPLLVAEDGQIVDGAHRLLTLQELAYGSALTREP